MTGEATGRCKRLLLRILEVVGVMFRVVELDREARRSRIIVAERRMSVGKTGESDAMARVARAVRHTKDRLRPAAVFEVTRFTGYLTNPVGLSEWRVVGRGGNESALLIRVLS